MTLPRISIVTPSYMQAEFLGRTLRSVLEQGYPDLEYRVMDGGSTDGSVELIRAVEDRLAGWVSAKDNGQADAIAKGFALAGGDVLGWLNSDDVYLPGALRAVGEFFESHPEVECVSGGGVFIDERGRPVKDRHMYYTLGVAATLSRLQHYEPQEGVYQQACFWRRSAYEAVGGVDTSFHFIMDYDLLTRLAGRRPLARLPRFLAGFRLHGSNKTLVQRDVFAREMGRYEQKYGLADRPAWLRRLQWARWSVPNVARKAGLKMREAAGLISPPSSPWE